MNIQSFSSNGILQVSFSEEKANKLSKNLVEKLAKLLLEAEDDETITSVIFRSLDSEIFSAGADLHEYAPEKTEKDISDYLFSLGNFFSNLVYSSKIIVAVVNGKSVGGALGFIAACDFVFAAPNSTVKLPELSLGIAPSVISPFLLRRIGMSNLKTLSFGGNWSDASRCFQMGLFSEIVPQEKLLSESIALVSKYKMGQNAAVENYKSYFFPPKRAFLKDIRDLSDNNAKLIKKMRKL